MAHADAAVQRRMSGMRSFEPAWVGALLALGGLAVFALSLWSGPDVLSRRRGPAPCGR